MFVDILALVLAVQHASMQGNVEAQLEHSGVVGAKDIGGQCTQSYAPHTKAAQLLSPPFHEHVQRALLDRQFWSPTCCL